jgi:hypothetical protein
MNSILARFLLAELKNMLPQNIMDAHDEGYRDAILDVIQILKLEEYAERKSPDNV